MWKPAKCLQRLPIKGSIIDLEKTPNTTHTEILHKNASEKPPAVANTRDYARLFSYPKRVVNYGWVRLAELQARLTKQPTRPQKSSLLQ